MYSQQQPYQNEKVTLKGKQEMLNKPQMLRRPITTVGSSLSNGQIEDN
jgi:arsenate reductase-like glutaredoxin family protein